MKIIIAPAKQMVTDPDSFPVDDLPVYLPQTRQLLTRLRGLSYAEAQALWHCSDRLAEANYRWLQELDLTRQLTPALLAYSGIQYQYMAPDLFTAPALTYVRANLRILSGFYGILRPFDGIVPYRLEMQAKLTLPTAPNLYAFWGDRLATALHLQPGEPLVNLASTEYARAITPYLPAGQPVITVVFASQVAGHLKVKATLAKMARGEMVRYLAEHQVTTAAEIHAFDHPDWTYAAAESTAERIVFIHR